MTTLKDVAERASVSTATVSHVINETRFVSDELKARVYQAMKELNYHPNAIARSLRRSETHNIGMIVPDISYPFLAEVARGVEDTGFELGYNIIIYLAGPQNVPQHLYDAARIDSAASWACFRHVTWPLLTPTSFLILIMAVINSPKAFAQMHVMTDGGPLGSTIVIAYYLYQHGFQFFNLGYASAVACVLFVVLLALTLIQFKVLGPRVHYQ